MPDNLAVVEGEQLSIHCKAFGTEPKIEWKIGEFDTSTCHIFAYLLLKYYIFYWNGKIGGRDDFNRTHVTFKDDEDKVQDAILIIEHAELTDRNTYNCTATNRASGKEIKNAQGVVIGKYEESAQDGSFVRVKGGINCNTFFCAFNLRSYFFFVSFYQQEN